MENQKIGLLSPNLSIKYVLHLHPVSPVLCSKCFEASKQELLCHFLKEMSQFNC